MADGDVVIDEDGEVNDETGTRFEMFAIEDSSSPGGCHYRFQYYNPGDGEQILRYDNAHDSDVGPHHRHYYDDVEGIEFHGVKSHANRFATEVKTLDVQR